jgi:hypothetical protein
MRDGYREESRIVCLPKMGRRLGETLMDMGIGSENGFEYGISVIKTGDAALNNYIEITAPDIDELNYIAGFLDSKSENSKYKERLAAVLAAQMPGNAADLINIMRNAENYTIYENVNTVEELGKAAAYSIERIDPESTFGKCVDYKVYGESFHKERGGMFADGKYILFNR